MSDLTWTTETRRLSELIPWPRNPRQIRKEQAERLADSLDRFGQVETIAIGPGNEVYNGHQRLNVWAEENGPDFEVTVRVASRGLTEKERERLVVYLHQGATGEWDFDTLANEFELGELLEWGFDEEDLGIEQEDWDYTRKIEAPEYEPSDCKPAIDQLFDDGKTRDLISAIDAADGIAEDERNFLRIAAQRHTVLHFHRIADYYAHSRPELQRLMEDNALVIIDFHQAISGGFVALTESIRGMVADEYGDA